jgi:peptidoglycan/LPS O-acetylase OafA/YrhL
MPHIPMERRKWFYALALAVIALLTGYDLLSPEQAPLWIALAAAVLGIGAPALALANMSPDESPESDFAEEHWADDAEAEEAEDE